MVSVNIRSL